MYSSKLSKLFRKVVSSFVANYECTACFVDGVNVVSGGLQSYRE
jgi:hypothetical protein